MRIKLLFQCLILFSTHTNAQGSDWEKDVPGKLIPAVPSKIPGVKINEVFALVNRLSVISEPKGFNVKERFTPAEGKQILSGSLSISFYEYYSFDKGPVQLVDAHPPTIVISYNNPFDLMNDQSIFLREQTAALNMPLMFTDTFALTTTTMNGYKIGLGVDTEFDSRIPLFVLNPRNIPLFRSVSNEEYLKFFTGKLGLDIEKETRNLEEAKRIFVEASSNTALNAVLPELQKQQVGMSRWISFLKEKKEYYTRKLAGMTPEEKKAPASYAAYKNAALMFNSKGEPLEKITGSIDYEPAGGPDAVFSTPIFTFMEQPFDNRLPKTAFQLIVILHAFRLHERHGIKDVLDEKFFPLFPYKELAALMFK